MIGMLLAIWACRRLGYEAAIYMALLWGALDVFNWTLKLYTGNGVAQWVINALGG